MRGYSYGRHCASLGAGDTGVNKVAANFAVPRPVRGLGAILSGDFPFLGLIILRS